MLDRTPVVKQLKNIFKNGNIPSRGRELYGKLTWDFNCLFHACFNLPNSILKKLNLDDDQFLIYNPFGNLEGDKIQIKSEMFKFIKDCGLHISKDHKLTLLKNQRRVALYFSQAYEKGFGLKDFHFLLQEKDGTWSSKAGSSEVEFGLTLEHSMPFDISNRYILDSTFILSNSYEKSEKVELSNDLISSPHHDLDQNSPKQSANNESSLQK